jgi:hypothetical protein
MDNVISFLHSLRSRHVVALFLLSAVSGHTQYLYDWVSSDGNPNSISATIDFMYPNSSLVPPSDPFQGVADIQIYVGAATLGGGPFNYNNASGNLYAAVWSPAGISDFGFVGDDPYSVGVTQDAISEVLVSEYAPHFTFTTYSDTGSWVFAGNVPDVTNAGAMTAASFVGMLLIRRWRTT